MEQAIYPRFIINYYEIFENRIGKHPVIHIAIRNKCICTINNSAMYHMYRYVSRSNNTSYKDQLRDNYYGHSRLIRCSYNNV